jgi:hypothetical protein
MDAVVGDMHIYGVSQHAPLSSDIVYDYLMYKLINVQFIVGYHLLWWTDGFRKRQVEGRWRGQYFVSRE